MSRKTIVALISGYIISMLPIWEITTRMQAITLMIGMSICVLPILFWAEEKIQNIKRTLTSANTRVQEKIHNCDYKQK